jgi:hypothetical protein
MAPARALRFFSVRELTLNCFFGLTNVDTLTRLVAIRLALMPKALIMVSEDERGGNVGMMRDESALLDSLFS